MEATALNILHGIFFLMLLIFTVYTIIMGFHWFTYGMNKKVATRMLALYLGVGALCFLAMGFAIL